MKRSIVIGVVIPILAIACSARKHDAIAYARTHARNLVESTRSLRRGAGSVIAVGEYPAEIRALKPSKVVIDEKGAYIYINASPVHVAGVFVRHDPKFEPPRPVADSDDWGYELVSTDIYWFSRPR